MSLNSYYIQFVLNSENHFSKNTQGNKIYNNISLCKVKSGQIEFNNQQMQFYNKQLLNGWYYNIFAKSKIIFLPINVNCQKSRLTKKSLKQILYRDYFLKNKYDNNNVYFSDYILDQIVEEDGQFQLKISKRKTTSNNVYGIVQIIKGCNGYFHQSNYVYKSYDVIQLNNNIFEILQIQNQQYKNIELGGQLTISSTKYNGSFIKLEDLDSTTQAYQNQSVGEIKTLLTNMIYETYEQAVANKPSNQKFHHQLFQKKQIKNIGLNSKIIQLKEYINNTKTKYKTKTIQLGSLGTKKISDKEILTGFVGGFFKQNIQFSLTNYQTNSLIANGYWYINDDQNRFYAAGTIQNYKYVNMPTKINAISNQKATVSLYYYSNNKTNNVDYTLTQNSYLQFYTQLNSTNTTANTLHKISFPNGANLTTDNGIDVLSSPYVKAQISTLPSNTLPRTISFLTKINEIKSSVLFSFGCSVNQQHSPYYVGFDAYGFLNKNTTPYKLKKYLDIGINSEGNIVVNKKYCNYTLYEYQENHFEFSDIITQNLITSNVQLPANKKQVFVENTQQIKNSFAKYYANKYNYCDSGENSGYFVSTDGKVRFRSTFESLQNLQCAASIKEKSEEYPYGSLLEIKLQGDWSKTIDCIVSSTQSADNVFAVLTTEGVKYEQILTAKSMIDWYFIQLKYDGMQLSLYIDNNVVGEKTCELDIIGDEICIGRNIQGGQNTTNYIRQFKIFNGYLSTSQSLIQKQLQYKTVFLNQITLEDIQFNFINNSDKIIKYEINVKRSSNKIQQYYRWLNYTPDTKISLIQHKNNIVEKTLLPIQLENTVLDTNCLIM